LQSKIEATENQIADIDLFVKENKRLPDSTTEDEFKNLKNKLTSLRLKLKQLNRSEAQKTFAEKQEQKKNLAQKQWIMIKTIEKHLMLFACFDFVCQIIA